MMPVLSRDYFNSDWCRLELSLMYHREQLVKFRTRKNPNVLIIPVVIDDGDRFPEEVQAMQCEPLHDYANPFIRIDSPRQEALAEVLRNRICPTVEQALTRVPPFDPTWEEIAHEQFENRFKIIMETQTTLPSLRLPGLP
jgi:hypothetical protein